MQRLANILLVAGGVFLTGNTTQANLISNGSFEFFITGPNYQDFGGYVRSFSEAHPAVPGRSICSMRVPRAGDQRRAGGTLGG
jgi:hypothetical protein